MDPAIGGAIAAKIGDVLTGGLVGVATSRVRGYVLGDRERTELEAAVRASARKAVSEFPRIADVSAEIDLFSDSDVVDELGRSAARGGAQSWPRAHGKWAAVYGTPAAPELDAFLAALAGELESKLRASEGLRGILSVWVADHHTIQLDQLGDSVADVSVSVNGVSQSVGSLRADVAALTDPAAALRFIGPTLGTNLVQFGEIVATLGAQIQRGPLGKAGVNVQFQPDGAALSLHPRPGIDTSLRITMKVEDTPEGRSHLDDVRRALARPEGEVELPNPDVTLVAGGHELRFPDGMTVTVSPAAQRELVILRFESEGVEPCRFRLALDFVVRGDEVHATTPDTSDDLVLAELVARADGGTSVSFRGNPRDVSADGQLKTARLRQHLARGGRVELWIADKDIAMATVFPGEGDVEDGDAVTAALLLYRRVAAAAGVEVSVIDELTPVDIDWLGIADRLLAEGEAQTPGLGQTYSTRSTGDILSQLPPSQQPDARQRTLVYAETAWHLPLSRNPIPLGPVTLTSRVEWPPHVERDGPTYVTTFTVVTPSMIVIKRGVPPDMQASIVALHAPPS